MSRGIGRKAIVGLIACLALALGVAACGSSDDSTTSSGGSGGGTADLAAANAGIKPYVGQPGAFPVVDKLNKVPKGATIAYVDCGTPVCALFWQLMQPAAQTMGVNLTRVKAGSAANSVAQAWDSVVAMKPDAVITTAINVELWKDQLKELQDLGIPVVTTGITGTQPYGIKSPQAAENSSNLLGRITADYVVAKFGKDSNIVLYVIPELPFTQIEADAFQAEIDKICPDCEVRTADIPVASIGNTAPSQVVSDLQAHPDTTVAVFTSDEAQTGVPAALDAAGIDVKTIGIASTPTNLEYVKDGKQDATLAYDLPVASWTLVDQAAREITGQQLTGNQAKGITDVQFLTKPDIVFNPAMGWTGYPDFAERFSALWGIGGSGGGNSGGNGG